MYISKLQSKNTYLITYITKYISYKNTNEIYNNVLYTLSYKCYTDIFTTENLNIVNQFFDENTLQFLVFLSIYNTNELIEYIKYCLINIMKFETSSDIIQKSKKLLLNMNNNSITDIWTIVFNCIESLSCTFKKYSHLLLVYYF